MADTTSPTDTAPTVLLVHGAFADSSGWSGVIERLRAAGVPVRALANPLRGLAADSAYVASAIEQTPGPVLAVDVCRRIPAGLACCLSHDLFRAEPGIDACADTCRLNESTATASQSQVPLGSVSAISSRLKIRQL